LFLSKTDSAEKIPHRNTRGRDNERERRGRISCSAAMANQGAKKIVEKNKQRMELLWRIILGSNVSGSP
jgi:hypothetical protein